MVGRSGIFCHPPESAALEQGLNSSGGLSTTMPRLGAQDGGDRDESQIFKILNTCNSKLDTPQELEPPARPRPARIALCSGFPRV
jgi:hypothetical protein